MEIIIWIILSVLAWPVTAIAFDYLLEFVKFDINIILQSALASVFMVSVYILYKILSRLQLKGYTIVCIALANCILLLFMHPLHRKNTLHKIDMMWEEEETDRLYFLNRRAKDLTK